MKSSGFVKGKIKEGAVSQSIPLMMKCCNKYQIRLIFYYSFPYDLQSFDLYLYVQWTLIQESFQHCYSKGPHWSFIGEHILVSVFRPTPFELYSNRIEFLLRQCLPRPWKIMNIPFRGDKGGEVIFSYEKIAGLMLKYSKLSVSL